MRLLHVNTLEVSSFGESLPPYAILSHTWEEDEVTLQDIQQPGTASQLKGFDKIQGCCRQAIVDGYEWVWIDTCCIDKTSSSELSEAINSMYSWYQTSGICYAYFVDVPPLSDEDLHEIQVDLSTTAQRMRWVPDPSPDITNHQIAKSRWFTRGWTLQELIAPQFVEFCSNQWTSLGTRSSLESLLALRTRVPVEVLRGKPPSEYCVSERMSWASSRITTRREDLAYCLFGLFQINMPLLYGEGNRAFIRLQEEILRRFEDMSLLAWAAGSKSALNSSFDSTGILAPDPSCFDLKPKVEVLEPSTKHYDRFSNIEHTWSLKTSSQYDPPLITSRGIVATVWLRKSHDRYQAWIHTGAHIREYRSYDGSLKSRPPMGDPKELSICIELRQNQNDKSTGLSETNVLLMDRYLPTTVYGLAWTSSRISSQKKFACHSVLTLRS